MNEGKCCICQGSNTYFVEEGTYYVPETLHAPTQGELVKCKAHRLCICEFFTHQASSEQPGVRFDDTTQSPFSCPLCRKNITVMEASKAAGMDMVAYLSISRKFNNPTSIAPNNSAAQSWLRDCVIL